MARWRAYCKMFFSIVLCGLLSSARATWNFLSAANLFSQVSLEPHIVDSKSYNVLFRLGDPTSYSIFVGPRLSLPSITSRLSKKAGNFFPAPPFELVDVSLMSRPSEQGYVEVERREIEKRPWSAQFLHWPIYGILHSDFQEACTHRGFSYCPDTMQPDHMSPEARSRLAEEHESWDRNQFEVRVQKLHALLEEVGPIPKVVFFHGLDGCDRTGALFAAYALRFRNRSLTEAIAENELIAGRHMAYEHQVAAQWYCEYLVARGLYERGYDCGNCGPFRCHDGGTSYVPMTKEFWFLFSLICVVAVMLSVIKRSTKAIASWKGKHHDTQASASCCSKSPCWGITQSQCVTPPTPAPSPISTPPPVKNLWRRPCTDEDYMLLAA